MKTGKLNQFDAFKSILQGKELTPLDKAEVNSFLMLRWLSGDSRTIQGANTINRWYQIPPAVQYDMFRGMLHGQIRFIKYPKSKTPGKDASVDLVQKHYNVSPDKAQEMVELISQVELDYIHDLYKRQSR